MGIKKLLFMYVEKARGFYRQEFNFSTVEHFHVDSKNGSFDLVWEKNGDGENLPNAFWKPNISEISLLIGENGSGKTTVMQMICQWSSQLSKGHFPQEEGMIVFQEDDRYGYVGFSGGRKKNVRVDAPKLTVYSENMLKEYFSDVKLIYFSNTMTDLNLESSEVIANHSMPQRIKEAWEEGGFINEDIIAGYKRYEFKKRYEGKKLYNKQINGILDQKSPLTYVQLEIDHLTFDELDKLLPKQYQAAGKALSDLWDCYFRNFEKGRNSEKTKEKEKFVVELLQAVFIGIITKLIRWEEQYTFTGDQGVVAGVLDQLAATDHKIGENSITAGGEWIRAFLKDLFQECREGYSAYKYKAILHQIWTEDISHYMDAFLEMVLSYLNDGKLLDNGQMELIMEDEKKSIRQIRLDEQNGDEFEKFWETYEKIIFYVETICVEWNASSGESNRANLYAVLSEVPVKSSHIWFLLDEPDNTFHLEWKRQLMKEFIDICGKQGKMIQAWISTHSPIMLSDVPGTSVIYLKAIRDGKNKIEAKKICEKPFKDTFGQNIYVLFNHAFFLENGVIGAFANSKILEVFRMLEQVEKHLKEHQDTGQEDKENIRRCEMVINLVAEPVFKKHMQQCLLKCKKMAGME